MHQLLDTEFLRLLDKDRNRTVYARIISLNRAEEPIEQIEGVVTAGSVSIDGESAVRRVAQLTLTTKNLNINNVYWGLTTKVKIEFGLQNNLVNFQDYDKIIWFKQGIFILTDFKTSQGVNNYTINVSAKDKMCLLNGEIAGNFTASIRLDTYTGETDDMTIPLVDKVSLEEKMITIPTSINVGNKIPISIIIQSLVHEYGHEALSNIIIKDLNLWTLTMMNYSSAVDPSNELEDAYYILYNYDTITNQIGSLYNPSLETAGLTSSLFTKDDIINAGFQTSTKQNITSLDDCIFYIPIEEDNGALNESAQSPTVFYKFAENNSDIDQTYIIRELHKADAVGYTTSLLTYPSELSGNIGEAITSALDKIVQVLGNYEYFYNLDGQFVFQAKPAYATNTWEQTVYLGDDSYVNALPPRDRIEYTFDSGELNTSFSNSPRMDNIKNDYIIWGERKTDGSSYPIHARFAIDTYPVEYTDFNGYTWITANDNNNTTMTVNDWGDTRQYAVNYLVDWRFLIYIMAWDWFHYNRLDDFEVQVRARNCWPELDINLYPYGKTGYEQYYNDMMGFLPLLYNTNKIITDATANEPALSTLLTPNIEDLYTFDEDTLFNINVKENPELLDFWIDFFEADINGIGKFATSVIGDRPKTINDTKIKTIFYRDVPDIIYCSPDDYALFEEWGVLKTGYDYILIPPQIADEEGNKIDNTQYINFYEHLMITSRGQSAKQQAENMLYQYAYYNDSISLSTIPIYYLEPNTIISVKDELSNIVGYYTMTKINLSLAYNGTMSINAIKIPDKLY